MRLWIVLLAVSALAVSGCNEQGNKQSAKTGNTKLETLTQKVSYSVGYDIARNFKENDFELLLDVVVEGARDAQQGKDARISLEERGKVMQEFQKVLMEKRQKKMKAMAEKNVATGKKFLEENAKKEGVVTLKSGLQYKVIKEGKGKKPKASDVVRVNYRGTLIDGTQFDSSYDRGKPAEFPVDRVIAGWTEALQLMPVGSKWQLFVPPNLAYGERGAGKVIEPNSVLVFEIELLDVMPEIKDASKDVAAQMVEKIKAQLKAQQDKAAKAEQNKK